MSPRVEEPSGLIGLIYDTALNPGVWPVALNRLADLVGAIGTHLGSYNADTHANANLAPRQDPERLRMLAEYWASRNILWQRSGKYPIGAIMTPDLFMSWDEYLGMDMFNEWLQPQGLEIMMATNLLSEGPVSMVCTLARPFAKGGFDKTERALFAAVIPHLQRAVQLNLRLHGLAGPPTGSVAILDRLAEGVILVGADAKLLFANRAAEAMLRTSSGLTLDPDGLGVERPDETCLLRRTIARCAQPNHALDGAGAWLKISRGHRPALAVLIVPYRTRYDWLDVARPAAMLFVTDPERGAIAHLQSLQHDHGLTPAEAAVALEIVKGDGLAAVAGRLGVSPTTVRTHLAHVFEKTGTRRQAELVRLLLLGRNAADVEIR